jgi:hypothetical protein
MGRHFDFLVFFVFYILFQIPVRFDIFKAVTMKVAVFWDVTSYSLVENCQRLGETFYLHLQGREISGLEKDHRQEGRTRSGVRSEPL